MVVQSKRFSSWDSDCTIDSKAAVSAASAEGGPVLLP